MRSARRCKGSSSPVPIRIRRLEDHLPDATTDPTPERIDAVVLAGTRHRLRSVVSDRPKPMAEVGGRPFLDLVLRNLRRVPGIGTVVLAVSHMAERIVERCASLPTSDSGSSKT